MMQQGFAEHFVREWVAAWNSHDLERMLEHYEDDFEMSSPIIVTLMGEPSGKLKGKAAVGAYWAKALKALPGMLLSVLPIAAMVSCAAASAQDGPRSYAAVVCTSEANGPWTEKARGTLTRTRSLADLGYRFEGAGQAFDWRFVTSAQGNTTVSGPGFLLMERFGAPPKAPEAAVPAEHRQSVEATGEIRESAGANRLALLIGSKCPQAKPPRRM